jgi:pyridoxine/pyridoxamine 5'-phosphate oxidase
VYIDKNALLTELRCHSVAVLATVTADGTPEAAAIEFGITDNLEIIFDTFITYRKYANLKHSPSTALVIGWDDITIQYEGKTRELKGEELLLLKELYFSQVPSARKFDSDPRTRWFHVTPLLIRYRDYRVDSERIVEYRFDGKSVL